MKGGSLGGTANFTSDSATAEAVVIAEKPD